MTWKPYPAYKPSGVEWLGDVPEGWEVKRLKTSALTWVSNVDKVPAEDELPVRLCNYTDVYYHDHITPDMGLMETTATADEIRRFGLRVGDIIITKDSEEWNDIAVPALVKETAPDLVCGYHLAIIRPFTDVLCGDYLLRVFQSCAINQQFQVAASGVTRYGLPKSSIGEAWIPLPELPEQLAIASFLDRETGKIDRLMAKKRELIEKLKEERAALISRAVTRGLNPDVKLKPSGAKWLGEVPEHWGVKKLRYMAVIKTGNTPPKAEEANYSEEGLLWVKPDNLEGFVAVSETKEHLSDTGRVLARLAPPNTPLVCCIGSVGKFGVCEQEAAFNQQINAIIFNGREMLARFGLYMVATIEAEHLRYANMNVVPILNSQQQGNIVVPVPPTEEQFDIVTCLDKATSKFERLTTAVEEAIAKLQEYRAALITAAVTGKIDVRAEEKGALVYPETQAGALMAAESGAGGSKRKFP